MVYKSTDVPSLGTYLDVGCSLFAPFIEVKVLSTKFIPLKICVNDGMDIYNVHVYCSRTLPPQLALYSLSPNQNL